MELQAHASTSTLPETPTLLPYITVQHDCLAVIQDVTVSTEDLPHVTQRLLADADDVMLGHWHIRMA